MPRNKSTQRLILVTFSIYALLFSQVTSAQAATAITGTVFLDYNNSGDRQTLISFLEPAVGGIIVSAYDSADNLVIATTTTASDGTYNLNIGNAYDGQRIRIEFTGLPNYLQPGSHSGTGSNGDGTTLQFIVGSGAFTLDLPLSSPGDYCGSGTSPNPTLITPCYVHGAQTDSDPTLISFDYNVGNTGGHTALLEAQESGSIYGVAYHQPTDNIFMGHIVKRHAGSLPNDGISGTHGLSTIYSYHFTNDTLTSFNLNTDFGINFGTDGRSGNWNFVLEDDTNSAGRDDNWDLVGKNGMGDIELSANGQTLYVANLFERRIEAFDVLYTTSTINGVTTPTTPTLSNHRSLSIPHPSCVNGVARPFGLGYYQGEVYSGWVCTAENQPANGSGNPSGTPANLSAHVFRGTTEVFSTPLDFDRGCAVNATNQLDIDPTDRDCDDGDGSELNVGGVDEFGTWHPWTDEFYRRGTRANLAPASDPQPILADIEFDRDGNMLLGFRDRLGDLIGDSTRSNPASADLYRGVTAGDLLRVCATPTGFVLEGAAGCLRPGAGFVPDHHINGQGSNGGEFFADRLGNHDETMQGSLIYIPGLPDVVVSSMDPAPQHHSGESSYFDTGGFRWMDIDNGNQSKWHRVFDNTATPNEAFAKANGLGDIEAICPLPEMEIGNLVWIESVNDGVQGTGTETTPSGVLLELLDAGGTIIAQTTTDASGHYYFNATSTWDANGDGTPGDIPFWDANGNGTKDAEEPAGVMANTSYIVRVAASNFDSGGPLDNYLPTTINASGSKEKDFLISDSEGLSVAITTRNFGTNNHTLDFGFIVSSTTPPQSIPPLPETGFAPDALTRLSTQPEQLSYYSLTKTADIILEIPALSVEMRILGVPLVDDGWDVSWLDNNAGYLQGTTFPTLGGNSVITAHVWNSSNQPGPFIDIKTLQPGDQINILAFGFRYIYEVETTLRVRPNNQFVLGAFDENISNITLLTCEDFNHWNDAYRFRRVVRAVLVEVQNE